MRIIDTGITKEILTDKPQIKIEDKLYTVDDRKSTFDKISKMQQDNKIPDSEKEKQLFVLALGEEATKEIYAMDLSVSKFNFISYCIMGAIAGKEPKEIEQQVAKQMEKN